MTKTATKTATKPSKVTKDGTSKDAKPAKPSKPAQPEPATASQPKPEGAGKKTATKKTAQRGALRDEVLAKLNAKPQTTREIVLALGRECGQKGGGPVLTQLHNLVKEGVAASVKNENYPGHSWKLK